MVVIPSERRRCGPGGRARLVHHKHMSYMKETSEGCNGVCFWWARHSFDVAR